MRYDQVRSAYPYIIEISIDPADLETLERVADERDQFRVVSVDKSTADQWKVTLACASERVSDLVHERFC